ncbi:MAG: aspartate kinase [Odoribacteraceae bacterium]|jgi:aspartate kinase|nr:aspartate kinase [Odoribacteraceae bacterium]
MEIFKFGGASVKDAAGVRQLAAIVGQQKPLVIVISAMGKMTNLLEKICEARFRDDAPTALRRLEELCDFHAAIIRDLFPIDEQRRPVVERVEQLLDLVRQIIAEERTDNSADDYDRAYDRLIPVGELLSTRIVSDYLAANGVSNRFVDVRQCLISDDCHRNANVDLETSRERCARVFHFRDADRYITQGFIAGTLDGQTTTLGREGSDYTAALLANLLDASRVTIWKDVPGVMNADPKEYPAAVVIPQMHYKEAIELTHFGAKVIHPKTIKPLQNKNIPLRVRSFLDPDAPGTVIRDLDGWIALPPVYINKENQLLLTLAPRDFSFIAEEKLSRVFSILARYRLKLNLMQNSAISFTFCVDNHPAILPRFIAELQQEFGVRYNDNVRLVTIRHYTDAMIREIIGDSVVLVEQRSRATAQFVI